MKTISNGWCTQYCISLYCLKLFSPSISKCACIHNHVYFNYFAQVCLVDKQVHHCWLVNHLVFLIADSSSIVINFNEESDHQCTLPVSWLKQHSYSPADLEVKARLRDVKYLDVSQYILIHEGQIFGHQYIFNVK